MTHPLRLATALVLAACLAAPPALAQQGQGLGALALELVNESRAEHGLPPLEQDDLLAGIAEAHAEDMLERDYYSHVSPEGEDVLDRYLDAGGDRASVVAENLARCQGCDTPLQPERLRAFHRGWMQSPGHRANILGQGLERFGFGTASDDGLGFAVQVFAGAGVPPGGGGGGEDGGEPERVSPARAAEAALETLNASRANLGLEPLEASGALDEAARAALQQAAPAGEEGFELPADPFALLPEDAGGWRGLSVAARGCRGCGAYVARGDGAYFAERLAAPDSGDFTHFGFALRADGEGSKTAVAVYGQR